MRGNGPTLLISQSGEGDAGRSVDLVDQLADAYTVITYDRRGLSRSTLDDPANPDAEPDLTPQPMTSGRIANCGFFIEHDFTALINDTLPVNELAHTPTRIVPAAGRTTPRTVFDYRCAQEGQRSTFSSSRARWPRLTTPGTTSWRP
ncbi:hypothetical protein [Nonomuraea sp. NPDC049709]|uniref:alpha/beta fold hydrolase n=1 Tax=Nonomuraea sp. NPDC049709 TaxID=3154736 RepID=UPI00342D02B6